MIAGLCFCCVMLQSLRQSKKCAGDNSGLRILGGGARLGVTG
jgi:hypothetical protein